MSLKMPLTRSFPKSTVPYLGNGNPYLKIRHEKTQKIVENYLDQIEASKSNSERLERERKLASYLNRIAPPTESQVADLNRRLGKILDEGHSPKTVDKAVKIAFNTEVSLERRVEQMQKSGYIAPLKEIVSLRGIPNLGNTCFMNAGFQLIVNNPDLINALVSTYQQLLTQKDIPAFKQKAYKAFLNAVISYKNGSVEKIDLNSLRVLFLDPETQELNAMGDVTEFMNVILEPLDPKKNPHLFCRVKEVKQLVLCSKLSKEDLRKLQQKNRELKLHENDLDWISQEYTTLSSDEIITKVEYFSSLMLPVPDTKELVLGQNLLNEFFSEKNNPASEMAIFKQGQEVQYFSTKSSQNVLESCPPYLNVNFNRYRNDGTKISTKVKMPEKLKVPTKDGFQEYTLEHVAIHTGAHYFALLKKNGVFTIANDRLVYKASASDLENALTKGYVYVYKKM